MPKTVLLADDSVTIQHAVGISLANEDIALVNVNNGEDAVIRARAIKPDLILLDVVMPKMSGYEACKQIRQDPSIKHTPIIMLIGAIEGFDENKFKESMANDYIIKPFESGALISKIRKYLYPELSKTIPTTQPSVSVPASSPPSVSPPSVVPTPRAVSNTSPQIPIPPKPAVPPVVPPIMPTSLASTPPQQTTVPQTPKQTTQAAQSVLPPMPPIPPHIQNIPTGGSTQQATKDATAITNFIDNLISPSLESVKKVEVQETSDEISPQDIEEITSEIIDLQQKPEPKPTASIVDIVSQVEQTVSETTTTPEQKPETSAPFDLDKWGKDLRKEVMEASGVEYEPPKVEVPQQEVLTSQSTSAPEPIPLDKSMESTTPIQVETIAETISSEPVGEPVKPVEVPPIDVHMPAEVEPTSLVEKKIDLGSPLSEETIKQVKEIVERVVWEVVPELAEKLIKEELKRLMSEKEE